VIHGQQKGKWGMGEVLAEGGGRCRPAGRLSSWHHQVPCAFIVPIPVASMALGAWVLCGIGIREWPVLNGLCGASRAGGPLRRFLTESERPALMGLRDAVFPTPGPGLEAGPR
jgi:hypothetical protein